MTPALGKISKSRWLKSSEVSRERVVEIHV